MIKAALFDMDGTLIDSEKIGVRAWQIAAERFGFGIPDELTRSFIGINRPALIERLGRHMGSEEAAEDAFEKVVVIRDEIVRSELELKPGARDVLDELRRRGVYLGLVTSSRRVTATMNLTLPQIDLLDAFDGFVFGDDVERSKPEPDIFLKAAERAGVDPAECAVIEDSLNGVRSGYAAGMKVYMVPDLIEPTPEVATLCTAVLTSLFELVPALEAE